MLKPFVHKNMIIFLSISLNMCLGALKNCPIDVLVQRI